MPYSDQVKHYLLSSIDEIEKSPEIYAVNPAKDFTRHRKIDFSKFLLLLLTKEGDCLREELYRFFGYSEDTPTKAAFHHQRAKLKINALKELLRIFNQKCCDIPLYKDRYRLVACDGSVVDIFRDANDKDTFFEPNGKSPRGFNQVHVNALYSILDQKFLDLIVQPARKRNEYSAFCEMVDKMDAEFSMIYIGDRGYASYNDFAHVIENKQYFLIRCTDTKTSRLIGFPLDNVRELDYHVDRILSRSHSKKKRAFPERENDYRYICQEVPLDYITDSSPEYQISLRIVRIEIAPGIYENLITNLPDIDFDAADLKELYHLRWAQENSYRDLKYPLCMKSFHSKKYRYIEQEIYARIIMYNYCSEIALHVEIPEQNRKLNYQVNFSEAIKICRASLRDYKNRKEINVEGLIADNIEPIRPDRTFRRQARFKLPMSFCYRH